MRQLLAVIAAGSALQAAAPLTGSQLAKHFARAKPEDLATCGRAHRDGDGFST